MFKNWTWTNRDWFWLTGILLFIMALLLANFYKEWDPKISIIANSTSIALAVIAIFLSLKQDSDSKSTSESMRQDFTTQIGNVLTAIASQKGEIDEVATNVNNSVNTNTEERSDSYTYEQLVQYGENIKKETIKEFKKEMNEKMIENAMNLEKSKKNINEDFLKEYVRLILEDNPNIGYLEVCELLEYKGYAFNGALVRKLLKMYRPNRSI